MALELQKQNYIAQAGFAQAGSSSASNVSTQFNIPIGQVEGDDYLVDNGLQATTQPQTKRTVDELYSSIANICNANGLNLEEAKKIGLLSSISGKTEEELLNVEQNEIDQIVQKITNAINAIKEDIDAIRNGEKELTFDLIKNYVRLLNGEIPKGWDSVESFRKAQRKGNKPESLAERLNRMYGCDVSKLSTEQLAKKLEAYFDGYFNELNSKGLSREKVDNLQLTDFTKLLFNSTPEEYDMFRDAIEYLVANNRCQGYKAILDSFETDAQRTKFANETTYEQVQTWQTKPDQRGEAPTQEQSRDLTIKVIEHKDAEHIEEYARKSAADATSFYTKETVAKLEEIKNNPEIIENILRKIVKGEKLSEEEQKTFDLYNKDNALRGDSAGQLIGAAINKVINEEVRSRLLKIINSNIYKIDEKAGNDFYKNAIQSLGDYVEQNPNALPMPKEDLIAMLDQVTEGNYSRVQNGASSEELVPPTAVVEEQSAQTEEKTTNIGLGYDLREKAELPKTEEIKTKIQAYTDEEDTTPRIARSNANATPIYSPKATLNDYTVKYGSFKGFAMYAKEAGVLNAIKEACKNLKNTDKVQVKKAVKRQNTNTQAKLVKSSGVSSIDNLLSWVREDAIKKLEGTILGTTYASKALEEANEKLREKASV